MGAINNMERSLDALAQWPLSQCSVMPPFPAARSLLTPRRPAHTGRPRCRHLFVVRPSVSGASPTAELLPLLRSGPRPPIASHVFHYNRAPNDRASPLSPTRPLYFAAIWPPFNSAAFLLLNCCPRHCCTGSVNG